MTVYLVGAGPGDPGLMTLRGAELLAEATVVVHDRLVASAVVALAGPAARRIDVGKRPDGGPTTSQEDINALLVELGRREPRVVRLKGGDPFVFGRGGEEALALQAAGVAYEVVPGISAALAAPAAAGVPLTHRGIASSFAVVSGHDLDPARRVRRERGDDRAAPGGGPSPEDWLALGRSSATLVVLMGASSRAVVAETLLRAGRPGTTPVAVVERGTTPAQATTRTTLEHLAEADVRAPAAIVVGEVAGFALSSYEDRRLSGRRIALTREPGRQARLAALLTREGAEVVEVATRVTADPADGGAALRAALSGLERFAWVVLSSPTAVERLLAALRDARDLAPVRLAVAGPGTAEALSGHGLVADLVASPGRGEGAADALRAIFPAPARGEGRGVLVPRAAGGRPELVEGLAGLGWPVTQVEAYQSVLPPVEEAGVLALASADAVVLASPSALEGFRSLVGGAAAATRLVTIGPTTSAAVRAAGLAVAAEAARPSPDGVRDALLAAFGRA